VTVLDKSKLKQAAKFAGRQTLGKLPPPKSRLTGRLAIDGGKPVRNLRYRPWATGYDGSFTHWLSGMGASLRQVFTSGVKGLPQPRAKEFAQQWAKYCGCKYGLLLPHGTDALRIGLAAALDHDGLDYGGEIIVPNFSFIATATSALDRRFGVAFVDVDPDTLLLDPRRVEEAIVPGKTRAIMPVHLFGQPADMTSLRAIAKKHGLKIIEDAAQAHGAAWETGPVGSLGDVAGFSFQSHKNLTSGEGGALTTNDEEIFERAYSMHNVGRARIDGGRWEHLTLGWNCRPTEYQAALLLNRFKSFERRQAERRKNFQKLSTLLENIECLKPLAVHPSVRRHGMHMFVMRYQPENCDGLSFEDFVSAVQKEGVPIHRAYQAPMSNQPVMQKLMEKRPEYFRLMPTPVSDQAANDTVYIPHEIFLGHEADMADIASAIRKVEGYCSGYSVRESSKVASPEVAVASAEAYRPTRIRVE
jgi:dTDP-4-amino-4,6-dideoxygalactose transaminase